MPLQQKTSKHQASLQNQSDRDGEAVEFQHGRELGFEERRPPVSSVAGLRGFLDQALADFTAGRAQESERVAKAVSALMRAPHPVGARIVKLDQRLARVSVNAHEWHEPLCRAAR
jgi:hypothetical protein